MGGTLLSASMIVKNEEKYLGACLSSLKGIVDEIVIVDTGSTDGSKEIAIEAGARVYDFPWAGDFSAARNYALDLSRGEWILYSDADEQVRAGSADRLREQLQSSSPALLGYEVLLHPIRGFSPYWILRVFRNHPSIRFRGVIHENIWPSLNELAPQLGGTTGRCELVMDHDGYEGDQARKDARNLPLLIDYLKQDPSRVFCWCQLGDIYATRHEYELAESAWHSAIEVVRNGSWFVPENVLPYVRLIERGVELKRDVQPLLDEALLKFPWSPTMQALHGRILILQGAYARAIGIFEHLAAMGASGEFDHGAAYDMRLFGAVSYEALASCHFHLRNYDESRRYLRLASQAEPDKLEHKVKLALCSKLEKESRSVASLS